MCWLSRIETKLNESVPIQTYVKLQLNEALLNLRDEHQKPHWHNKQREVILHYNYLRVISSEGMPPIVSQLCCTCHSPYLSLSPSHTHHCPQTSPWQSVCWGDSGVTVRWSVLLTQKPWSWINSLSLNRLCARSFACKFPHPTPSESSVSDQEWFLIMTFLS